MNLCSFRIVWCDQIIDINFLCVDIASHVSIGLWRQWNYFCNGS